MQETKLPTSFDGVLRTARVVHFALCLGVVVLTVILVVVRHTQAVQANVPVLLYVAIAFAVIEIAAAWIVPVLSDKEVRKRMIRGEEKPQNPDPLVNWAMLYQTRMIIRCALLNGAAFLQPIAYLLTGHPVPLVLAGTLFLLLVLQYPTRDRVTAWIDRQRDLIEQERQAAMG
jgi:hypothetical protein